MADGRRCRRLQVPILLLGLLVAVVGVATATAFQPPRGPQQPVPRSRRRSSTSARLYAQLERRGPLDPAPVYRDWEGGPVDGLLYRFFRAKVVHQLEGEDVADQGYSGLMELVRKLIAKYPNKRDAQLRAQNILRSLFPSWLPGAFAIMFSKPLPGISARMNAYITMMTTYWLMGESTLVDVEIDGGKIGKGQGLLVKRCRFLEEAGCASVCVNVCQVPTQAFFLENMGLPLQMSPDYDTFECEFAFGKTPPPPAENEALRVPCFAQCPSAAKPTASNPYCHQIDVVPGGKGKATAK